MPEGDNTRTLRDELKDMVSEIIEVDASEINDTASFGEDLGVDSMMALEIVSTIEKKYKVHVDEERIPEITCMNNVYSIVETGLKE